MKMLFYFFVAIMTFSCGTENKNTPEKPHSTDTVITSAKEQNEPQDPGKSPKYRDIEADPIDRTPLQLVTNEIKLSNGKQFDLMLPEGFEIYPAAEGLRRVRFFAKGPDGRLFVTGLYNLSDNNRGSVFILEDFDPDTKKFNKVITWKDKLRNPNSVQFYRDNDRQDWLYLALTDSLIRYKYTKGETSPTGKGEKITDFPGYGLNYKYGGWHLTRTIAFHFDKLYVSVGSSCNLCEEKPDEPERAAILVMDPDGSRKRVYARGVRNAVDIGWVENKFYATNMAADHLGKDKPNDYFYELVNGAHYGWPYCYEHEGKMYEEDPKDQSDNKAAGKLVKDRWERLDIGCEDVPPAYMLFGAHDSPLGFEYFGHTTQADELRNYFLVALHGSTNVKVGTGHRVVRMKKGHAPEPFIDGFLVNKERNGRPCDIFQYDENSFFLSDDLAGVVYFIQKTKQVAQ